MKQGIYIEKADLKAFKERIKNSELSYTIQQESTTGNYKGFIQGTQKDLLDFAYKCGRNKLFIVFLYP